MQFYDAAQQSLAHSGSSVAEEYLPLWASDGTTVWVNDGVSYDSFIMDGSTNSTSTPSAGGRGTLHTLNSNWSLGQQYAFEATIYATSPYTAYASIRDLTSGTNIIAAQISTTSTTATVIRSGKFTLIPGHSYGVSIWQSNSSGSTVYLSDASLIVFGQ